MTTSVPESAPTALPKLSSITSKAVMALTGLGLLAFVIGHMIGNLQVFAGPEVINSYAEMLKDKPALLWTVRIGLLTIFIVHIWLGVRLKLDNVAARPDSYAFRNTIQASLASRTMIWTGLVILAFVIFHLAHYTFGIVTSADGVNYLDLHDAKGRRDVYAMTVHGFKNVPVSFAYSIAQILLGVHLSHGIGSLFQSLGVNHPRYTPWINRGGVALAVLIVLGNCSMPLAVLLNVIKLPA
jgi:succinate dehydrogenase / fumarate reductase cytochrome b subunit